MRLLLAAALVVMSVACGAGPIQNLPLSWQGVSEMPRPTPSVAQALANVPIAFGLRDVRTDPTAVGSHEEDNHVVRTSDNVAQYCSARIGEMLRAAGARLDESPVAVVETDLVEFRVNEGGRFNGLVALRVNVRRTGSADWSKTYQGTSSRWGKSHSPDNFNEALSNALAEAVTQLVKDDAFALALMAGAGQPPPIAGPAGG